METLKVWKEQKRTEGQRVGWEAYGCWNQTFSSRTWPVAATWSHKEMPQDLRDLVALITMSKKKKWKMILENPEVSPSPLLIRSWLKFLLKGHQTKGIRDQKNPREASLLPCSQGGVTVVAGGGVARNLFDLIKTQLSNLNSSYYFGLFAQTPPLLPMELIGIVFWVY